MRQNLQRAPFRPKMLWRGPRRHYQKHISKLFLSSAGHSSKNCNELLLVPWDSPPNLQRALFRLCGALRIKLQRALFRLCGTLRKTLQRALFWFRGTARASLQRTLFRLCGTLRKHLQRALFWLCGTLRKNLQRALFWLRGTLHTNLQRALFKLRKKLQTAPFSNVHSAETYNFSFCFVHVVLPSHADVANTRWGQTHMQSLARRTASPRRLS